MVENKDIRKLSLYSKDGVYDSSVEATILSCFIHLVNLPVSKRKDIKELKAMTEANYFTVDDY